MHWCLLLCFKLKYRKKTWRFAVYIEIDMIYCHYHYVSKRSPRAFNVTVVVHCLWRMIIVLNKNLIKLAPFHLLTTIISIHIWIQWTLKVSFEITCLTYDQFLVWGSILTNKLIPQEFQQSRLEAALRRFYGRYKDLIYPYNLLFGHVLPDVFYTDR
jgi:hypothetical protein